jgi:hypothetical protein
MGVQIMNCGNVGTVIQSALSVLNTLFPNDFGVLVDCGSVPGCTQVTVEVPSGTLITDIDVCANGRCIDNPGGN